jgi:hypothetical protein
MTLDSSGQVVETSMASIRSSFGERQLANVVRSELIRRAPKVPRKILDRLDVAVDGSLSVITTLEFFEHRFAKVGHRCSPYDPTLSAHTQPPIPDTRKRLPLKASFKRASGKCSLSIMLAKFSYKWRVPPANPYLPVRHQAPKRQRFF